MTRCLRCLYALIHDRCPMCGGRKLKGVPPFVENARVVVDTAADPLPVYWSPRP